MLIQIKTIIIIMTMMIGIKIIGSILENGKLKQQDRLGIDNNKIKMNIEYIYYKRFYITIYIFIYNIYITLYIKYVYLDLLFIKI